MDYIMLPDLLDLFDHRDDQYMEVTKDILTVLLPALNGIVDFFGVEEQANDGKLRWEDVDLISDETYEEDVVLVTGRLVYDIGDVVTVDGTPVTATESNVDFLNRTIRIGLPLGLAKDGTKEEVSQFLLDMEKRRDNTKQKMIDNATNAEDPDEETLDTIAEFIEEELKERNTHRHNITDFNLEDLTEEQRHSYFMYMATMGRKK